MIGTLRAFGQRDPKGVRPGTFARTTPLELPPHAASPPVRLAGPGTIRSLQLRLPRLVRAARVRDDGRAFGPGGGSSFTLSIDGRQAGVRLTRRYDPVIGHQRAAVTIDGQAAGEWNSGPAAAPGGWAEETLTLPAAVTAGKTSLTVSNVFLSSDLDFNEFRYDVACLLPEGWTRTDTLDLGPGHPGEEGAHAYAIRQQTFEGDRTYRYPVDPAAEAASRDLLARLRLRITFDGSTTVDAPVGEFFGSGLGAFDVRALMFSLDALDGVLSAWWPMPYLRDAVVELVNGSDTPLRGGSIRLEQTFDPLNLVRLRPLGDLGYFHASAGYGPTVNGQDWTFTQAQGRGVFYGVTHSMRGLIPTGNRREYLEGDERAFADGSLSPLWHGTGTEDFYESGWYFRDGTTFVMPDAGNPAYDTDDVNAPYDSTGAFRLLPAEALSFGSSVRFGIEHGPGDDKPAIYSSTAYWYGQTGYTLRRTDALDPGLAESRNAHAYRADGETVGTLTSTFEADNHRYPVSLPVTGAGGMVAFRLAVDPVNRGVRLSRLADQGHGYQVADVYVNGTYAGRWTEPLSNATSQWLEDWFELPAALTSAKAYFDVRLEPVAGAPPWTAARYEAVSRVLPFADSAAPGPVSHPRAEGDTSNSLRVFWVPARDDVGVAEYEVYGSQDAGVPVGPGTLVGRTPVPGFRHDGLGLEQTWFYRVRAVDASGHVGPLSAPVSARTGNTLIIEGESLLPPLSASAPLVAQANCCDVVWSGNAQLWFIAARLGDTFTVALNVPQEGNYQVAADLTKARDYGTFTLAVDGATVGAPYDGFNTPAVLVGYGHVFGTVHLTAGTHPFTVTVTAQNPASVGFLVGIDRFLLTKTD